MSYLYVPLEESCFTDDAGEYISYGIAVTDDGGDAGKVSDVSTDLELVREICEKCNRGQLDPLQLREVIEDHI